MADFYTDIYRSGRQRQRFPVKFSDEIRKEICIRYALGDSTSEIHAWITEDLGIKCSYNAVRGYLLRKRWRRFMATLKVSEMSDPVFQGLLKKVFEERLERWEQLEKAFNDALETANDPRQSENLIKAAKILVNLYGKLKPSYSTRPERNI